MGLFLYFSQARVNRRDMNALSASIVAYKNPAALLRRTIDSFLAGTTNAVLYLIDNSPTDDLRAVAGDPRVVYRFNKRNLGFGAAHNIAIRQVLDQSKYHLVLNPDVYFDRDTLPVLSAFMEAHEEVGQVMPKVLHPDGRLQYLCKLLPTPRTMLIRGMLNFLRPALKKENYRYELQFANYDEIMDVPFLSGCFMLLRTAVLKEVGLFDERFFLFAEDTDLTRRIHRHSRTVYFPSATVYHHRVRGRGNDLGQRFRKTRSLVQYFNKWGWLADAERERINRQILLNYAGALPMTDRI